MKAPINTGLEEREFSEAPRPGPGAPLAMELRGYELARFTNGRWEALSKYRPVHAGWAQAMADGKWLQERHPGTQYRVRVIVSMDPPTPKETSNA